MVDDLRYLPGFEFRNDVSYMHFLNRVREGETKLQSRGLWNVPHPWLNMLIPRSRILEFDRGVFKSILKHNNSVGPILICAMNRNKCVRLLHASNSFPHAHDESVADAGGIRGRRPSFPTKRCSTR